MSPHKTWLDRSDTSIMLWALFSKTSSKFSPLGFPMIKIPLAHKAIFKSIPELHPYSSILLAIWIANLWTSSQIKANPSKRYRSPNKSSWNKEMRMLSHSKERNLLILSKMLINNNQSRQIQTSLMNTHIQRNLLHRSPKTKTSVPLSSA